MIITIDTSSTPAHELRRIGNMLIFLVSEEPQRAQPDPEPQRAQPDPDPEPQRAQPDPEPQPVDLPMVRALLAELSRTGKKEAVQQLLTSFGYDKLTSVPSNKLAEIYEKGKQI